MSAPRTLLQLANAPLAPASIDKACLVLIDIQNEYLAGPIAVAAPETAIGQAMQLLMSARSRGAPVIHVVHRGRPGGLFDRDAPRGQSVEAVAPIDREVLVEKTLPNAFAKTDLQAHIERGGRKELIVAGFMTHMCVSSTVRAALDLGYRCTVAADACGTRDLPDIAGGVLTADVIHRVALAELADRFAIVSSTRELI
jgi:nicotinamidase-related amidase